MMSNKAFVIWMVIVVALATTMASIIILDIKAHGRTYQQICEPKAFLVKFDYNHNSYIVCGSGEKDLVIKDAR